MKKSKPKRGKMDVDGPFEQARDRVCDFGESLVFTVLIQNAIKELEEVEEELELAHMMDNPELILKKQKERDEILRTLAYAGKLLEEENGINA